MAEQMRVSLGFTAPKIAQRVRAVDATAITEPGSTGTDWRIHYAINLANLQCDFFQLTDVKGGEAWRRFPVMKGGVEFNNLIVDSVPTCADDLRSMMEGSGFDDPGAPADSQTVH